MMNFTRDMFEIALPGADGGHLVNVTMMFARGQCTSSTMASFTGEGYLPLCPINFMFFLLQCQRRSSPM